MADAPEMHNADHGVYGISVAAELVGMAVPSLRLYESHGLLDPDRTAGGTRRYSVNDLERLRTIADLLDRGVNLTGIGMILRLEERNTELQERHSDLEERHSDLEERHSDLEERHAELEERGGKSEAPRDSSRAAPPPLRD